MSLIPNIPPKIFTFSAVGVGYLLIDDTTANEQNALGNWLMLVAQTLCTNAYYLQVQNERKGNTNSNNIKQSNLNQNQDDKSTIIMMRKMMNALEKEINEIKKRI